MEAVSAILAKLLGFLGGGVLDRVLSHMETRANSETERLRIRATAEANAQKMAASVVTEGMQHKAFWIPWLIAAIPTTLWYGWGMTDSLFNGALPDVAALPPQLKGYADVIFSNIFYVGGGAAAAQMLAGAIRGRK